jgi:hypothetical protein
MGVQADCRHYSSRSTPAGDVLERCRLGANQEMPFACPDDCVFFEARKISDAGWLRLDRPGDEAEPDDDPDTESTGGA